MTNVDGVLNVAKFSLIVGLGNPGSEYEKTRHNAGFWFLDALANREAVVFSPVSKFSGDLARSSFQRSKVLLFKPSIFMNRSGQAVSAVARYYGVPAAEILVVHDDLDLEVGSVRLKSKGGHGGHNGLRDIISHLGSRDFARLRFGIGHPGKADKVHNYVLARPSVGELQEIELAIGRAMHEFEAMMKGDLQKVMTVLHS